MRVRSYGFTLIELLVVVSIISMLASTVLTATNAARAKGRDSQRVSQIRQVQLAVELYYSTYGYYPQMHDENDIPGNWKNLLITLEQGKFIARAQDILKSEQATVPPTFAERIGGWLAALPTAQAAAPVLNTNIQDPQYPAKSYGYMPGALPIPYQNFRIRAQLEDTGNPVLKSGLSGMFLWSDEDPESYPAGADEECAPLAGYYCIGPQLNSNGGFSGFDPGKPVVYLYPTHTMPVSVAISPKSIDESIPAYGHGWNVIAHPDGSILNPADSKTYPYLYWEGKSDQPAVDRTQGFVVKTADLGAFFSDALAKQGLTNHEASEFMDYWVPLMTANAAGDAYTYIYFMPQTDYSKIVPMSISPTPDTLIRIYMLYKPLAAPINVTPQALSAPARTGFTAVEWGGNRSPLQ